MIQTVNGNFNIKTVDNKKLKQFSISIPITRGKTDTTLNTHISNMIGDFFTDSTKSKNTLSSIINELLSNAFKYSKPGSNISLNTYVDTSGFNVVMDNICSKNQLTYLNRYLSSVIYSKKPTIELYLDRSIKLNKNPSIQRAQLGIISLICNFGCTIDIKTIPNNDFGVVSTKLSYNRIE